MRSLHSVYFELYTHTHTHTHTQYYQVVQYPDSISTATVCIVCNFRKNTKNTQQKNHNEKNKKCPRETRVRVLPVVHCVVFTLRCTIHVPGLKVSIHTGYKVTPGSWKLSWLLVVKLTKLDEEEKNN